MKKYLGNKRVIIFLIAPTMILISVMVLYPMLVLVVHSFTEWDGLNPATFNGISNYIKLFKDPIFYTGLKNGLIFAGLQALIQIPLATLGAAISLSKNSSAERLACSTSITSPPQTAIFRCCAANSKLVRKGL